MGSWGGSRLQAQRESTATATEYRLQTVAEMADSAVTAVLVSMAVILVLPPPSVAASPGDLGVAPRRRNTLSPPSAPAQYLRVPLGDVLFTDDFDDPLEIGKRQFDDYGHMRFGKRGGDPEDKFDDYGHMRFGRGHV